MRKKTHMYSTIIRKNNKYIKDFKEKAEMLNSFFANLFLIKQ